jgi:hypothetical protein
VHRSTEKSERAKFLKDLIKLFLVLVPVEIVGISDSDISIEDGEVPVSRKEANEVRFEIEAHRLVVRLVNDDESLIKQSTLLSVKMLFEPRISVQRLSDINLCSIVEHVDDRPIAASFFLLRPNCEAVPIERENLNLKAGHTSYSDPVTLRLGTSFV